MILLKFLSLFCLLGRLAQAQPGRFHGRRYDLFHRDVSSSSSIEGRTEVTQHSDIFVNYHHQPDPYFDTTGYEDGEDGFNQDWSMWTEWSFCSRTCGGGVAMRTRRCGIRTLNDIARDCDGGDIQHKTCNTMDCVGVDEDFRTTQCAEYNNRNVYNSAKLNWLPHYGEDAEPCTLYCRSERYNFYKSFGPVRDGTRCWRDRYDTCIAGKCMKVGCDHIIGSNLTEDACGVCGGDNTTCSFYKNTVTRLPANAMNFNYMVMVVIPVGAMHLRISDATGNYLALAEEGDTGALDYKVNGNWVISWPGDFRIAGTVMKYERADDDKQETITIAGPTVTNIHITILYVGEAPHVEYEYWRPKHNGSFELGELRIQEFHTPDDADYDLTNFDVIGPYSTTTTSAPTTTTATTTTTTTTTTVAPTTTTATVPTTKAAAIFQNKKKIKPAYCTPCKRPRNRKRHFCQSDFVIHARVLSKRKQEGKRFSHDVVVKTVYKAGFKLMRREYLWVYSTCCPKLRPYRDYLIMGRKRRIERTVGGKAHFVGNATSEDSLRNSGEHFETRLVVDHMDYWHVWKRKYEVGMSRMANKLKCPNSDRVLRPYVIRDPEKRSAYLKRYRQRRMRA